MKPNPDRHQILYGSNTPGWDLGVALEEIVTGSGLRAARCGFDTDSSRERTLLLAVLESSNEPFPAKTIARPRRRKVVDCPDVDKPAPQVSILPQWDALPDESEDYSEIVPEVEIETEQTL